MIDRRTAMLGSALVLGGAAAGIAGRRPGTDLGINPVSILPQSVGGRQAAIPEDVILPNEDALSARIYDDVSIRTYVAEGLPPITLVMAYGARQDYSFQIHRPEVCYLASGFRIESLVRRNLPIEDTAVPGNVMQARRGRREETVLYWTRIGDDFPQGLWDQRQAVLRGVGKWQIDEGVLLRLSMPSSDMERAASKLGVFAKALIESAGAPGRRILLGK